MGSLVSLQATTELRHKVFRTYLPAAPWETATSILACAAYTTDSRIAKQLFAGCMRRNAPLVGTLPCRAWRFCEATEQAYGDEHNVLRTHTLLPLYLHGMDPELRSRAESQLIGGTRSRICAPRLRPVLECGNRYGLQCPECAAEAHHNYGRRVSFCFHCAPFVTRCPLHECRLFSDDECSTLESMLATARGTLPAINALRFARLAKRIACDSVEDVIVDIWSRLRDRGYICPGGSIRLAALRSNFSKMFSAGFEDVRLNELLASADPCETFVRCVLKNRATHPVYLVLMDWLSTDVDFAKSVPSHSVGRASTAAIRKVPASSLTTIKRHEWTEHLRRYPSMTRTQTRLLLPATWVWLYRHDREWLNNNQPPRTRPNGTRRRMPFPQQVAQSISSSKGELRSRQKWFPPLPSAYQMRLSYGMSDYGFNWAARELGGVGRHAALPALKEVFVAKRVAAAITALNETGMTHSEVNVARQARLRLSTVVRYRRLFVPSTAHLHGT
ncbi:hypothetical protein CFB81_16975 [Burkholderia sp. AU28863]|nr:hypothetical protein CFB81_16975 [Burkholderia sp. AU28863]